MSWSQGHTDPALTCLSLAVGNREGKVGMAHFVETQPPSSWERLCGNTAYGVQLGSIDPKASVNGLGPRDGVMATAGVLINSQARDLSGW